MTELAQHGTGYDVVEGEPPHLLARNLRVGAQLWSSATAFFFFAFLFAYFYLRSLNNAHAWKPKCSVQTVSVSRPQMSRD